LTVTRSLPSNPLELEVSLLLGLESMDTTDVDGDTSAVAAVEADGGINVDEGPVAKPDTAPECDR
jgi:hypothetical protein